MKDILLPKSKLILLCQVTSIVRFFITLMNQRKFEQNRARITEVTDFSNIAITRGH